jgi:dolichyl-phosphate-mannose-protein mannosyltransferase
MDKKYYLLILTGLGLLTHFVFFGHPNETVFDEVHFGKFVSGYYTREYFFDIHPPLGKLAIAGFAKLFDFKPEFAFGEIGDKFPDKQYLVLRFLPNLAGSLLPLVIFLLLMEMGMKPLHAFFGGILIALENALLTQSHYILLDSFLLLSGFLALLFYFKYRNSQQYGYLILFGLLSGLAFSVKWTGLGFLGLPLVIEGLKILKNFEFKKIFTVLLAPLIIAGMVYFLLFAVHLIILNKTGPGDAFMSPGFQKTLSGSKYADDPSSPSNLIQKFTELNAEMYKANQRLNATHPYSSKWYSWPFMQRTIYYWVNENSRIYLVGNPVIWWSSTTAVLMGIIYLILSIRIRKKDATLLFLLAGYVVNILPFIGVSRVMFLYHYFTAYVFAIMILAWLIAHPLNGSENKNSKIIFGVLITASVIGFLFFAPLSYGLDLSTESFRARIWLKGWE